MAAVKAAEKVIEASDVVADVKDLVEDTVELAEGHISWVARNPRVLLIGAFVTGAAIGSVVTFLAVRKKLEVKYQAIADEQVEDVKSRYTVQRVVEPKPSLEDLAGQSEARAQVEEIIEESGYLHYDRAQPMPQEDVVVVEEEMTVTEAIVRAAAPIERNVFESDNPDTYFDFKEELERRDQKPLEPFVITQEEFNDNDTNYDQTTLTYYDGDDVLADSNDQPLEELDRTVGVENMLRFGHGSGDPNVVYIRNARLELDIEVVHSDGKFAKEVLGFDDELQHSNKRPVRRFRPTDE